MLSVLSGLLREQTLSMLTVLWHASQSALPLHSPIECVCALSSSSLLMLITLTDGLVSSEITMACRVSCATDSSSQCGSTLQQFSSSSSSCSFP